MKPRVRPSLVPSAAGRALRSAPRALRARGARASLIGSLVLALAVPVAAQEGGGLRLGGDAEDPREVLDLGATPGEAAAGDEATASETSPDDAASEPAPSPGADGAADGKGEVERNTYGDWEVACAGGSADNDAAGGCAMAQIGNDATGTPVLEMVVRRLAEPLEVNEQTAVAVLDVITPLGVVLTEGLSMQIDSAREESAPFQICTEQGCLVREPIGEDLIRRLKRGRVAKISVFAANQGEVTSDISLTGFTKAYDSMR